MFRDAHTDGRTDGCTHARTTNKTKQKEYASGHTTLGDEITIQGRIAISYTTGTLFTAFCELSSLRSKAVASHLGDKPIGRHTSRINVASRRLSPSSLVAQSVCCPELRNLCTNFGGDSLRQETETLQNEVRYLMTIKQL